MIQHVILFQDQLRFRVEIVFPLIQVVTLNAQSIISQHKPLTWGYARLLINTYQHTYVYIFITIYF